MADKSSDLSLDTQDSSIRLSQVGAQSSLNLSSDELMQSGRTDEFMSLFNKELEPSKGGNKKKLGAIERKQLQHDIDLLRIKLSEKTLIIDNLKNEHMSQVDELEDRLHDALFKKQRLQAQLDNAISLHRSEVKKLKEKTVSELQVINENQEQLQKANRLLEERSENVRGQLETAQMISKDQYIELKAQPKESLSISKYFSLRLYEGMEPLTLDRKTITDQRDKLSADVVKLSNSLHTAEQELIHERRERARLDAQCRSQTAELNEARKLLEINLGKVQRFDIVMSERNKLERDYGDTTKRNMCLEAEEKNHVREIAQLKGELHTASQELHLLKQDKEYLTRNLTETQVKLQTADDNLSRCNQQMETIKLSREELYEKYAASREEARSSYEQRLQDELSRLRLQTERELDKVRGDSREAYERENRSLREARDMALHERDQIAKMRDDAEKRCESYASEIRSLEGNMESRVSDLHQTAHTKTFELDRLHLVHEETCRNLERAQMDNDKKTRKLELVTADFGELQRRSSVLETELRAELSELKSKLSVYESLEKEMDDIVMQAAEVEDDGTGKVDEAERVLFSYGYGANVPITAKRRMKQSVQLARRVLQLEKLNSSHRAEIDSLKAEVGETRGKLAGAEKVIADADQPLSYMVANMRKRDGEIEEQHRLIGKLRSDVEQLRGEKDELMKVKRQMSLDLDRLLANRQELAMIKNVLLKMSHKNADLLPPPSPQRSRKKVGAEEASSGDAHVADPAPVVFTKQEPHQPPKVNRERYRLFKNLGAS